MNAEVVTVATHEEGLLKQLVHNNFNIKVKVLGFGKKWTGFQMKFELIYNYIKNLPDDKIIIFLDGFDSTINGSLDEAVRRFKNKKSKVLFSNELDSPFYGMERFIFPSCRDNTRVNSGMYMGYVKYLKMLLEEALAKKCKDDQVVINRLCKKFDFIEIDINEEIFKNIYNTRDLKDEMSNSNALFYSQPGVINYNRAWRALFEYGQYFIPYIIISYIVVVYFLYKSKKLYHILLLSVLLVLYYIKMDKSCTKYVL